MNSALPMEKPKAFLREYNPASILLFLIKKGKKYPLPRTCIFAKMLIE
jgi:hypothetical protein